MSDASGPPAVPPNVAPLEEVPNEVENDKGEEEEPDPEVVLLPSFVADLKARGIIVPRSVAKGNGTQLRKYTVKYRAWLGAQVA